MLKHILPKQASIAKPEKLGQFCVGLLQDKVPAILPKNDVTGADIRHLVGISCLHLTEAITLPDLGWLLTDILHKNVVEEIRAFLRGTETGKRLEFCWEGRLSQVTLTSQGLMVGLCAFDELTGDETDLDLYFP
jgi:hypothetical protein